MSLPEHGSGTFQDTSWEVALEYSRGIGRLPSSFPEAVRMLIGNHLDGAKLTPVTKYQVARVLRSPNFKSMLYYATSTLSQGNFEAKQSITVGEMMEMYSPMDLASFISAFVLMRKVRRLTSGSLWDKIHEDFVRDVQIGSAVGMLFPSIGFTPGIIWGIFPHLAHGLMAVSQPETYRRYRSKRSNKLYSVDPQAELDIWGCTSAQVISLMLSGIGYRKNITEAVANAVSTSQPLSALQGKPELAKLLATLIWFRALLAGLEQPAEKLPVEYYPFQTDKDRTLKYLNTLSLDSGCWIERTEQDISPQKTPTLFTDTPSDPQLQIPDQLKEVFTIEQIGDMDEWEFDKLVDHLDQELTKKESGAVLSSADIEELEAL